MIATASSVPVSTSRISFFFAIPPCSHIGDIPCAHPAAVRSLAARHSVARTGPGYYRLAACYPQVSSKAEEYPQAAEKILPVRRQWILRRVEHAAALGIQRLTPCHNGGELVGDLRPLMQNGIEALFANLIDDGVERGSDGRAPRLSGQQRHFTEHITRNHAIDDRAAAGF